MRWVVKIEREDDRSGSEANRIERSRALRRPSSSKRRHPVAIAAWSPPGFAGLQLMAVRHSYRVRWHFSRASIPARHPGFSPIQLFKLLPGIVARCEATFGPIQRRTPS
jgi:hypothetical protein